jgi:hypothetical protein
MTLRNPVLSALTLADTLRPSSEKIRVYVGGTELLQANGKRPKVSSLGTTEKFTLLPNASADVQAWRIRIIGNIGDAIAPRVTAKAQWAISWDDGLTRIAQRPISITRNGSDTAWVVNVEQIG